MKQQKKTGNQEVLYQIAKSTTKNPFKGIVSYITDEEKLIDLARDSKDVNIRKTVVDKIEDQKVLIEFATEIWDCDVRKQAVNNLTDQETLRYVVIHDSDSRIRELALSKFDGDKESLKKEMEEYQNARHQRFEADMAKNNQYSSNRESAIHEITDEKLLEDIALNGNYDDARRWAARKITDESILINIANNANDKWVRNSAVDNITNQEVLKFIFNSDHGIVRESAISNISDEELLIDVAINDSDEHVRENAKRRLKVINPNSIYILDKQQVDAIDDNIKLLEVMENALEYSVKLEAVKNITNEEFLIDIINTNENEKICEEAIRNPNFSNQDIILDIINNNSNWHLRKEAVKKVTNQEILLEIVKNDEDSNVRKEAIQKITNQEVLFNLAESDDSYDIRREAASCIENEETRIKMLDKITKQETDERIKNNKKEGFKCPVCNSYDLKYSEYTWLIDEYRPGFYCNNCHESIAYGLAKIKK